MSKLAKTGGTLLGLAALGTFVAALGGPNVFSVFSSAMSTISPKTEIAVEGKKEEKQNEDKAPIKSKQEEKNDWIIENKEEVKEEKPLPPTPPVAQPVPTIIPETKTEPKVQPQVVSQETHSLATNSTRSSSSARTGSEKTSGREQYPATNTPKGAGSSEGSGIWCGTSWGSVMMKEGDTCLGSTFEEVKRALTSSRY